MYNLYLSKSLTQKEFSKNGAVSSLRNKNKSFIGIKAFEVLTVKERKATKRLSGDNTSRAVKWIIV